jgi:DNA-binding NtrC family response regulator
MPRILVVDDEENIRKVLSGLLNRNGFNDILFAADGRAALDIIEDNNIDLVISDINMPKMDGIALFEEVKDRDLIFIILTAYGSIETAVAAVKNGVYDFISKPFDESELVNTVKKALNMQDKKSADVSFAGGMEDIYFSSRHPAILEIKENLERVVKTRANILITGETGTGKGLLAGILHKNSPYAGTPLIKVNCAAIPANLMESELFGYKKGAFTGAGSDKPGKFELADSGTLFLDEIGELDFELQAKLLNAIQDREITRLGDVKPIKIDVRIISATNMKIKEAIAGKKFREDLFYRLNVVSFELPPLRERKQDIKNFTEYFNKKYSHEYGIKKKIFEDSAFAFLESCTFRGNIRELENAVQKIIIMEKENRITEETISKYMEREDAARDSAPATMLSAGKDEKAKREIELIKQALNTTGGNKTKAAEVLGISRRTLLYRIKEYGM